ncbi:MAG: phosphate acetyltransferase [Clostridiales bacterium]|nr:phosphate acetyltransferase [Clostridiales bacterium]
MSNVLENIKKQAGLLNKHIVLPEGEDKRVVRAAAEAVKENIARITLLGNLDEIKTANPEIDLSGVNVVDPATNSKTDAYAEMLFNARKGKINKKTSQPEFATVEDAKANILKDLTMYGALMLKAGDVDGLVSGACHSTANTLRPGLQVIKTKAGVPLVSSCFVMLAPENGNIYCPEGVFIYGDCGLNQNPNSEELAYIAISSAESAKEIVGIEPRVAFLSHSSKGSARHADVDKVTAAVAKCKELAPDLKADGEFQLDCAIVPAIAKSKAPNSEIAGQANVLIFPDLDAGNIGYKLTERLGGFMALGPICQGFAKPINDLSRGCSSDDVKAVIAITALQAK